MAPTTIAINQQEAPEVSPIREPEFGEENRELYQKYCRQEQSIQNLRSKYKEAKNRLDRMRTEGTAQKKMILDMSDIVEALRNFSNDHDHDGTDSVPNTGNGDLDLIAMKIKAIDTTLKTSMLHTVQLEELKKIANTTISDQEQQIENLKGQVALLEARMKHTEKHEDILLPDTSYEAQIDSMHHVISNLQSEIKDYEYARGHNNRSMSKPKIIDLTGAPLDPPVSGVTKEENGTASCTTEDVTSHPSSSMEDDYREAKKEVEELVSTNGRLNKELEESVVKMSEVSESASALQDDLRHMAENLKVVKVENSRLLQEKVTAEKKIEKLDAEVAEAASEKNDFAELEATMIAQVEQLEQENSLLREEQENTTKKIVELTVSTTEAENTQRKLQEENNKLKLENSKNAELLEQLSKESFEKEQLKRELEALESTVIARVEELEKENKSLKEEKEGNLSLQQSKVEELSPSVESQEEVATNSNPIEPKEENNDLQDKLVLLGKLEQQNKDYMEDVKVLAEDNSKLKVVIRELQDKNDELSGLAKELQNVNVELANNANDLQEEISSVRDVAKDLEKKFSNAKKTAEETQEVLDQATDTISSLEQENKAAKSMREELEEEIRKSKDTIKELNDQSAETDAKFKGLEAENRSLVAAVKDVEAENDRLLFSQEEQKRASVVSTTHDWNKQKSPKTEQLMLKSLKESLQRENDKLKEENDENLSRIADLTNALDDKEVEVNELKEAVELMDVLESENKKLKAIQELESENKKMKALQEEKEQEQQGKLQERSIAKLQDQKDTENKHTKDGTMTAEEAQKVRQEYLDMQTKLAQVSKNLQDLQNKHSVQQSNDGASPDIPLDSRYNREKQAFNRLKSLHQAVAMKLADLGEENATLRDQLEVVQAKVANQQETIVVLETIKEDYAKLMDEYHQIVDKFNTRQDGTVSLMRLQNEYADAKAKMTVLQWENDELSRSREMYHNAEARIATLERQVMEANENLTAEKGRSAENLSNTKEVICAYQELEAEHKEVSEKVKMLQSLMEGETDDDATQKSRAVGESEHALMEKQRNAAWKQVRTLEANLTTERNKASSATEARIARERDLMMIFKEYGLIQCQYEKVMKRVDRLKAKNHELKTKNHDLKVKNHHMAKRKRTVPSQNEALVEIPEEKPVDIIVLDDVEDDEEEEDHPAQARISNELVAIWQNFGISTGKQSGDRAAGGSKPRASTGATGSRRPSTVVLGHGSSSCGGCDQQSVISRISTQLELQQEAAESAALGALQERHDSAVYRLEQMEGELLLAKREAEDAKKTEVSKEIKLRDGTAKLFKLEREHRDLQAAVSDLRSQLAKAKREAKTAEAEAKGVRKRLDERNSEFKELQERHDAFMRRFSEADASKMEELMKDNESMIASCKEYLNIVTEIEDKEGGEGGGPAGRKSLDG